MTTETTDRSHAGAALPDHSVIPPVWSRITNLVVEHGEGSWLVTAMPANGAAIGRSTLPRLVRVR